MQPAAVWARFESADQAGLLPPEVTLRLGDRLGALTGVGVVGTIGGEWEGSSRHHSADQDRPPAFLLDQNGTRSIVALAQPVADRIAGGHRALADSGRGAGENA